MPDVGFVNGRFMPLAEATVPVEDRGFQFGDGVYEVVRTYGGKPFLLEEHLGRLERSAEAIELAMPFTTEEWRGFVEQGLEQARFAESKVYIQVTRGASIRDHAFPRRVPPTTVMTVRELRPLDPALRKTGVSAITTQDFRWGRCDIKSINLLPNVLAKQRATAVGAFEAIFVRDGLVTEGAVSNVIIVCNGRLCTAAEDEAILSGVTRCRVLDLARKAGIPVEERPITLHEVRAADEVFLTGTTVEVLSVTKLDGQPVGHGAPGPMAQRLATLFSDGKT